ncbi:MAG: FGGY-family carbohydrate kinase [Pseudomonadota bacterium]
MGQNSLLAIDCGTQSLRALLFSETGELLDRVQVEYEPYFSTKPGWAEQDSEVYWQSLCSACIMLKERNRAIFRSISGVGITCQRDTMICVDNHGIPLRPAVTWLDQRKARPVFGSRGLLRTGLRLTGLEAAVTEVQADGKCNWIMQNQPEIWGATHKYLQVSGFLNFSLTGVFSDSVASQIGYIPFNYKKQRWAKKLELPALLFPVDHGRLPDLIQPGHVLGAVTPRASAATGITQGVPVVACGSDKGCETLGAGVLDETMASMSFGTTATVQTTSRNYFEVIRFMPPYPAVVPGKFNPELEIFRGFWMISWFKNQFAHEEVEEARTMGIPAEEILDRHLVKTGPGAMGLVVQPYWGPGLDHPLAKGAMIGFGDVHTKAHIYRAVIEGLGYALREGLERIEKKGNLVIRRAAVSGGASQSAEICRIMAGIMNRPMVRGMTHETSGLGAAILTAIGTGIYSGFDQAVQAMVHVRDVFEPDPEQTGLYQDMYQGVYKKMYAALEPLYARIKTITGYPE